MCVCVCVRVQEMMRYKCFTAVSVEAFSVHSGASFFFFRLFHVKCAEVQTVHLGFLGATAAGII